MSTTILERAEASALIQQAHAHLRQARAAEAVAVLDRVRQEQVRVGEPLLDCVMQGLLADALFECGRVEDGVYFYRKSLATCPGGPSCIPFALNVLKHNLREQAAFVLEHVEASDREDRAVPLWTRLSRFAAAVRLNPGILWSAMVEEPKLRSRLRRLASQAGALSEAEQRSSHER